MVVNRSSGGPSEFVRKTANDHELSEIGHGAEPEQVSRLLNALVSATLKQLNARSVCTQELSDVEFYLAQALAGHAVAYKQHLSLPDPVNVAVMTSDELESMKSIIQEIDASRRLDGVIAKANDLILKDDVVFSRNGQEIWLGRRVNAMSQYYLSARVATYLYFDATPPVDR